MKLTSRVGGYTIEVEGQDSEDLFRKTAEMQELLSYGNVCGKTGNPDIIMRVRSSGEYEFFEYVCPEAGTTLSLGRTKAGGFYPKRKDKAGDWLPNKGWLTWQERKAIQEGNTVKSGTDDFDPNF
tara:strand:+ start:54 stop:428 length:375 start_codon:yes stop_codon:yes gene_type:complete